MLLCKNSFIFHYGLEYFGMNEEKLIKILTEKSRIFKKKWGFNIGYYSDVRHELIEHIKEDKQAFIRVLEVGCGMGATLSKIKYLYRNGCNIEELRSVVSCEEILKEERELFENLKGLLGERFEIEAHAYQYIVVAARKQ